MRTGVSGSSINDAAVGFCQGVVGPQAVRDAMHGSIQASMQHTHSWQADPDAPACATAIDGRNTAPALLACKAGQRLPRACKPHHASTLPDGQYAAGEAAGPAIAL